MKNNCYNIFLCVFHVDTKDSNTAVNMYPNTVESCTYTMRCDTPSGGGVSSELHKFRVTKHFQEPNSYVRRKLRTDPTQGRVPTYRWHAQTNNGDPVMSEQLTSVTKRLLLVLVVPHSNLSPHTSYCNSAPGFARVFEAKSTSVPQGGPRLRHSVCFHFTIACCPAIPHNVIPTKKHS